MEKILIISFAESIHTAKWLNNLNNSGYKLYLFPSRDYGSSHELLNNITIFHSIYSKKNNKGKNLRIKGFKTNSNVIEKGIRFFLKEKFPKYRLKQLLKVIKKIKPDIIHSMEFQSGCYLVLEAKKILGDNFPKWIVTNWGSDLFLFKNLNDHSGKIKEVLSNCDYYTCECKRDVKIARDLGFKGKIFKMPTNSGGFDIDFINEFRNKILPSKRKLIMLKGYQGWAGRALVGLRALERCSNILNGFEIIIYSADYSPEVKIAAEIFNKKTGIPIKIIPINTDNSEILKLHSYSRISIGLSISDAISTSMLEAIAMGSFPIQSFTSCADEIVKDGINGFLVPPEDPEQIEQAIVKAIKNDNLVDDAAKLNFEIIAKYFNKDIIKEKVNSIYGEIESIIKK